MSKFSAHNLPFYWSYRCLHEFYRRGNRHVVISPGSRSTPLTLAAAASRNLNKHVVLDERSASFLALGIGKSTGFPAVLICTSGTAGANYFPAVIEARKAAVPLLVLTADRPPELHGTGANQTIDQHHLYGNYPLFFKDMGMPSAQPEKLEELRSNAASAVKKAYLEKGPVHLNFPFGKPLEPDTEFVASISAEDHGKSLKEAPVKQTDPGNFKIKQSIASKINSAEKPLFIIGQLPAGIPVKPVFELARAINAPVLSESGITAPEYALQRYVGFLNREKYLKTLKPDLILRFGLQPAGKSLLKAIEYWREIHHFYFSAADMWSDIAESTDKKLEWNGLKFRTDNLAGKPDKWLKQWKKAESEFAEISDKLIKDRDRLTDGHVYEFLSPTIPESWFVFFSNSFPARDRSMFGSLGTQKIYTNRGASGIDGITSTAMGTGIGSDRTGVLFTGDLAFLHDSNALLNHQNLTSPLIVIVINNRGGSIFRMLPIARHEQYFRDYFETPQNTDIAALAGAYGIGYTGIMSVEDLEKLDLKDLAGESGSNSKLHIVECITDPDASMKLRNELWGI